MLSRRRWSHHTPGRWWARPAAAAVTAALIVLAPVQAAALQTAPLRSHRPVLDRVGLPAGHVVDRFETAAAQVRAARESTAQTARAALSDVEVNVAARTRDRSPAAVVGALAPEAGGVEGIIRAAAREFGADPDLFVRIARCESGLNPHAVNPHSHVKGLFQIMYWPERAANLGYGPDDWSDPRANSRVAGWLFQRRGSYADWAASKHCWQ